MTASEENLLGDPSGHSSPEEHSRQTAEQLRVAVAELASQLRPFPGFFGMSTIQAIELELPPGSGFQPPPELGCVVVLPDGSVSRMASGVCNSVDMSVSPGQRRLVDESRMTKTNYEYQTDRPPLSSGKR